MIISELTASHMLKQNMISQQATQDNQRKSILTGTRLRLRLHGANDVLERCYHEVRKADVSIWVTQQTQLVSNTSLQVHIRNGQWKTTSTSQLLQAENR